MQIPVSSRSRDREKSRKRRLELTGKPFGMGKRKRMKEKFSGEGRAVEGRDQDCSEELSTLLRNLSGGRRIHNPQEWI